MARIRALGEDVRINVTSMGPTQLPLTTIALAMGLNIRVGMEDNVLLPPRRAAGEQRAARGAGGADRRASSTAPAATPAQARELLALRGR